MCIVCNLGDHKEVWDLLKTEYDLHIAIRNHKQSLRNLLKISSEYKDFYYKFVNESKKFNKIIELRESYKSTKKDNL